MTEAEWLACTDPHRMYWECLHGRATDRQVRLYACAYARRVWKCLTDPRGRTAVEVAERYADGQATPEELRSAARAAVRAAGEAGGREYRAALYYVLCAAESPPVASVRHAFRYNFRLFGLMNSLTGIPLRTEDRARARLLRDVFNPFHAPAAGPPPLTPAVRALAQAAYDQRHLPEGTLDNTCLAILADALEDAGCTDARLLGHLRAEGPHVRSCWAVDLLTGRR
jgi:hypothetical protein